MYVRRERQESGSETHSHSCRGEGRPAVDLPPPPSDVGRPPGVVGSGLDWTGPVTVGPRPTSFHPFPTTLHPVGTSGDHREFSTGRVSRGGGVTAGVLHRVPSRWSFWTSRSSLTTRGRDSSRTGVSEVGGPPHSQEFPSEEVQRSVPGRGPGGELWTRTRSGWD